MLSGALRELAKSAVYRMPLLGRLLAPRYRYKVDPAQLAAMVALIDATRTGGGAILEIGVARGGTSIFLLEHLKTTGDDRPLHLFDTFAGFTAESIAWEIERRGKPRAPLAAFRYADERRLARDLGRAGYAGFHIHKGDAARFDWPSIGPVGAVLLDVDLYLPTRALLEALWPMLAPGGGIVVDDCLPGALYDGAGEAAREFAAARGLTPVQLGAKGMLLGRADPAVAERMRINGPSRQARPAGRAA